MQIDPTWTDNAEWRQSMTDHKVVWEPWQRKFAWTQTVVNGKPIWFKFYYEREGKEIEWRGYIHIVRQTASDLFDILKKGTPC